MINQKSRNHDDISFLAATSNLTTSSAKRRARRYLEQLQVPARKPGALCTTAPDHPAREDDFEFFASATCIPASSKSLKSRGDTSSREKCVFSSVITSVADRIDQSTLRSVIHKAESGPVTFDQLSALCILLTMACQAWLRSTRLVLPSHNHDAYM